MAIFLQVGIIWIGYIGPSKWSLATQLFLKKLPDKNLQNMCALDRVAKTVGTSVHESTLSDIVFVFLCSIESRHTR